MPKLVEAQQMPELIEKCYTKEEMRKVLTEQFYNLHEGTKDLFAEDLNADVNAAYAMIEIYRTLFPEEQNTNENNVRKAE